MEMIFYSLSLLVLASGLDIYAKQNPKEKRLLYEKVDSFPGSKSFKSYESISPLLFYNQHQITSTLQQGQHVENVTVYFKAFNRSFILDLQQNKDLFSKSYVEKRHHSTGVHTHQPQISNHCYYHGIIRGSVDSLVAMSTCQGVYTGLVSDGINTYHIENQRGSHRIYRDLDQRTDAFKCGNDHGHPHTSYFHQGHQHSQRSKRSVPNEKEVPIRGPYDGNENTRFVELYLVNDRSTTLNHNSSEIVRKSQDIVNIVSRLYRPLNIYVALVGVEIWESRDKIVITKSPDVTLENFLRYRRERINPFHTNDNAQLITGTKFDEGVVGKAIKGRICTFQYSGGVNYDYDGLTTLATTVAHELGHSFGMEHDNDSVCRCPESKCIMAATSGMTSPTKWSSCSISALRESFEIGMDYCLRNKPEYIYKGPVCGNGLVEDGETCDCGLPQDCTNRCCNSTTCQLVPQAQCGTGRCCDLDTCRFKDSAVLCRAPVGECDLPEFCNGTMEYCPDNVYKKNGLTCGESQSYCYKGQCNTHSKQCKLLWGTTGRASDPICYQNLNMQGTHDGNCGYNWTRSYYTRCHKEDVMCGLLHCVHLNEKLMFWRDSLAHTMRASFLTVGNTQYVCRSAMLDVGIDMPDPGMVPDGAKCEDEKICVNHKCVPLAKLPITDCSSNCANHGVCNSKGNCHCDIGYAPPLCDKPGYGGSIDSGQASNEQVNTELLIGLLVFFLILLLSVIIFLAFFYRKRLQKVWKNMPEYTCRIPMKPIFNRKEKRPSSIVIDGKPVHTPSKRYEPPVISIRQDSPPDYDPNHSMLAASSNRKTNIVISNPSQQKPLVPKHEPRPKSPEKPKKKASEKEISAPKIQKFVPENIIFKPEPKISKNTSTKSSIKSKSKQDIPLPPKPVISPKSEKKPLTQSKSEPESVPLSPKSERIGIQKRESFRGAEISAPTFVSTTNRNSNMFDDLPDTLPREIHISRSPSARGVPPVPPHGKEVTVKRSKSDRSQGSRSPVRPSNLATQDEEEITSQKKLSKSVLDRIISPPKPGSSNSISRSRSPSANTSFRSLSPPSRPLPPEPRVTIPPKPKALVESDRPDSTGVYMNNPATLFDGSDLLDDITQYLNTQSEIEDERQVNYTNIPEGSKVFEGSESTNSKNNPVNKYARNKNTSLDSQQRPSLRDKPSSSSKQSEFQPKTDSSKTSNLSKPSVTKNKPLVRNQSASPGRIVSDNKNSSKPGEKTHVSRINSGPKPATPPKKGVKHVDSAAETPKSGAKPSASVTRTKSPTGEKSGVTRSASQVSALTAKFNQEKILDISSPSDVKIAGNKSNNRPKPPIKKIQSFNV